MKGSQYFALTTTIYAAPHTSPWVAVAIASVSCLLCMVMAVIERKE